LDTANELSGGQKNGGNASVLQSLRGQGPMNLVIEEEAVERLPITVDPEIMSGAPVFEGTRVPVDALLNNLADGVSLDEFLENFPTVSREQALAILSFSTDTLNKLGLAR
jgi:uncharacterized protein (DUF433 family)